MDPKSMPKPSKGGQGPPQGAPGGDFDSFWSASRPSRDQKRGVRKMDRKRDPQKNRLLEASAARGWRFGQGLAECAGPHLGLKIRRPLRGARRVKQDHGIFEFKSQMPSAHSARHCPNLHGRAAQASKSRFFEGPFFGPFLGPPFSGLGRFSKRTKTSQSPPLALLGGVLGRLWSALACFWVHFEGPFWFNFHHFSA